MYRQDSNDDKWVVRMNVGSTIYIFFLHLGLNLVEDIFNSTSHASRKLCAPWGVVFYPGGE